MATKKATDEAASPLLQSINPKQVAANNLTSMPDEADTRTPAEAPPDPKDNPALPDDESAIADPADPTTIAEPGSDPDFAAK